MTAEQSTDRRKAKEESKEILEQVQVLMARMMKANKKADFYSFANRVTQGPWMKKCPVMIDSGCSMNMTPRADLLVDMKEIDDPIRIILADGETSSICKHIGKMNLVAKKEDGSMGEITVKEVALVPTLESTLESWINHDQ